MHLPCDKETIALGMPYELAAQRLVSAGAVPVDLQTVRVTDTTIRHEYECPNGDLLALKVDKRTGKVSMLLLCRHPSPSFGKALGKWIEIESIGIDEMKENSSTP